jgi:chemosensory pili system protein ChpA (sensor histidine kinase/response regulator)
MRDALYLVGSASSNHRTVRRVKDAYQLAALMPEASPAPRSPGIGPPPACVKRSLPPKRPGTSSAPEPRRPAGLPGQRGCAVADRRGGWLTRLPAAWCRRLPRSPTFSPDPSRHSEALAMETATAILLAQNAQENIQYLGSSFTHQVDVMVARIRGCIRRNPAATPGRSCRRWTRSPARHRKRCSSPGRARDQEQPRTDRTGARCLLPRCRQACRPDGARCAAATGDRRPHHDAS